jgi:Tetratricopeptide repeat
MVVLGHTTSHEGSTGKGATSGPMQCRTMETLFNHLVGTGSRRTGAGSEAGAAMARTSRSRFRWTQARCTGGGRSERNGPSDAYNNRAWAYFNAGKAAQGLPDAERSLQLLPNNAHLLDTRGHIFEALGRREEAITDFRRALSINPKLLIAPNSRLAIHHRWYRPPVAPLAAPSTGIKSPAGIRKPLHEPTFRRPPCGVRANRSCEFTSVVR